MTEPKFKVGDKVFYIPNWFNDENCFDIELAKITNRFKITNKLTLEIEYKYLIEFFDELINESQLLTSEEAIAKFKEFIDNKN